MKYRIFSHVTVLCTRNFACTNMRAEPFYVQGNQFMQICRALWMKKLKNCNVKISLIFVVLILGVNLFDDALKLMEPGKSVVVDKFMKYRIFSHANTPLLNFILVKKIYKHYAVNDWNTLKSQKIRLFHHFVPEI